VVADPSPAYHGLQFHETFGTYGYLMKLRAETLRDLGGALSPFNAFLFLQGLETLSLRMERHVTNAVAVASFLEGHEKASNVSYPGLPSNKYQPLVDKYLPRGAGAVFSFDCAGGRIGGQDLIRGVTLWSHLANVGDAKSLIIHPASTTHRQLSDEELLAAGVRPGTVRLSVGIESVEDLIWDLEQALEKVQFLWIWRNTRIRRRSSGLSTPPRRSRSSACRATSCGQATSLATTSSGTGTP
jgi:O-acetylhomoserine (thiol)-lyase